MSNPITDPIHAEKLARAIVADLVLYNKDALRAGATSPTAQQAIEEGRALYRQRVDPALSQVFESALASKLAALDLEAPPPLASPSAPSDLMGYVPPPSPEPSGPRKPTAVLIAIVVLALMGAGAAGYFFTAAK
jgi:hypothetical protein